MLHQNEWASDFEGVLKNPPFGQKYEILFRVWAKISFNVIIIYTNLKVIIFSYFLFSWYFYNHLNEKYSVNHQFM